MRIVTSQSAFREVERPDSGIEGMRMAEFIIKVLAEIVTDIWTLHGLPRWWRKRKAAEETASDLKIRLT
ncbi:hypothetical protein RX327_23180 [Bradyrhizobium sp. BEA-2-5]|uniref:hypothetical protein n=1 Tax=Bradyrhizobium TaxID=374 RepID=UPI000ABB0B2C|nr:MULTISPECIES: hypothetical protein [Bradyrhizobium]WOH78820.1 hypothetical protein RX327_23180 [Bradyrhizobium sp. BEA-2-5]